MTPFDYIGAPTRDRLLLVVKQILVVLTGTYPKGSKMKRIKFTVQLAILLAVSILGMTAVQADTATVSTNLASATGTRALSGIASSTALVTTSSTSASASFSVSAVEVLADGVTNGWSVIAISGDFARVEGGSIAAANFAYAQGNAASRTVTGVEVGTPYGTINAGTNGPLDSEQTLFSVSGETAGTFPGYTGIYTGVGNITLTVPAGTASGIYTATVTITLVA